MSHTNHRRMRKERPVNHFRISRITPCWIVRANLSYPGKTQKSCKWIKRTFRRPSTLYSSTRYRRSIPRMTFWAKIRTTWTLIFWASSGFSPRWTQVICNNHRFIINSPGKISSPKTWINLKNQTIKVSIITTETISRKWPLRRVSWTASSRATSATWPSSRARPSTTNTTARRKASGSCAADS